MQRSSWAAALAVWFAVGLAGQAAEYPQVMFILDSSGSMSEQVAGKQKLAAAKEVMHQVVPALDEKVRLGLTVYGHRRPGDCSDIEVLIPPGSDDRAELLGQVDALKPVGKTPISAAILAAANELRTSDAETTIILVSDGIETCGGDPCAVVAQLKSTGTKFVMHVIGFDVNAAAAQQLECIAGAGGGRYFAANDAEQLLDALRQVSAEVQEKVQEVEPAIARERNATTTLGKLRITMPVGSETSLAQVIIEDPNTEKLVRAASNVKADGTYPLRAGEYKVSLAFAQPNFGKPTRSLIGTVRVGKGETRELKLGSISFNIPEKLTSGNFENRLNVETVIIADAGTNAPRVVVNNNNNGHYNFKPKPVAAGIYNVLFRYQGNAKSQPFVVARNVVVEPGKDTVVTLDSFFQLKPIDGLVGWQLVARDAQVADAAEDGAATANAPPAVEVHTTGDVRVPRQYLWVPYAVPPGSYDLMLYFEGMPEPLPAAEGLQINSGDLLHFDTGL